MKNPHQHIFSFRSFLLGRRTKKVKKEKKKMMRKKNRSMSFSSYLLLIPNRRSFHKPTVLSSHV